jgi:hypothetical protein
VNGTIFEMVNGRIRSADRAHLLDMPERDPITKRSSYDRVKETAPAATLSNFRARVQSQSRRWRS